MIVRGNEVLDNYGSGLWWDGYNRNAQVCGTSSATTGTGTSSGRSAKVERRSTTTHRPATASATAQRTGTGQRATPGFLLQWSVGRIVIYDNTIDGAAYSLRLINHNQHSCAA
jgi:hypothetical protein